MKKFKRIFLAIVTLALGLALVSCKDKDTRNTVTPYGTLDLNATIATANNDAYKLTTKTFYDRLRTKSFDLFIKELKYDLFSTEIEVITKLINGSELTNDDKKALSFTGKAEDIDTTYLKNKYTRLIQNSLASSAYGTYSLSTYNLKTADALELAVAKYVQTLNNKGYSVTADQITPVINKELGTVGVDFTKLSAEIVKEQVLTQAQYLYSEKELYKIADLETLETTNEDGEVVKTKNSYYLFQESNYQTTYETSLMNYGEYQAIIIQFNSYKEAKDAVSKVTSSIANPANFYLDLYNSQYGYRKPVTSIEDEVFTYEVTEEIDDLSKISSGVYTLVTETLKDGEFLTEPRNINNKYVMAYRINTNYTVGGAEKVEYDDLTDAQKETYLPQLQRLIIESNGSNYFTTAFNKLVENTKIEIYDPFLEYKFEYSYATQYETVTTSNNEYIYKIGESGLKVDDFYKMLVANYGQQVILDYFSLEYASQYVSKYVSEESQKNNKEAVETAIKAFEKDENATYPKEIGLETFLTVCYGYTTKDDVVKYYYNNASALSSYKSEIVNAEWAQNDAENADIKVMSDSAKAIIDTLKTSGKKYTELFNINIDHILINFDDNGDGNPDDPKTFLADNPNINEADFQAAIAELAQEIYKEAAYLVEKGNTTFEAFKYIVKQYNKGAALNYDATKDWDQFKTYNFLLTAEQLASSSDITQASVSNFVVPFADYVKALYNGLSDKEAEFENENGKVAIVTNGEAKFVENASEITFDSLCATNYGYHLLVVNEYSGPESLKATNEKYNAHFIKVSNGDDLEDEDDDVYVTVKTLNDNASIATTEQLYVYFVQKTLSITSTLDEDIVKVLSALYDEAITTYTSGNFQTLLLIDTLDIKSTNSDITKLVANYRSYYVNLVTNYDAESTYATWCANTSVFR